MYKLICLVLFTSCIYNNSLVAQTGVFTDPRDGNVYSTITLGKKKWMREHLRFQTTTSWCPPGSPVANCSTGNFYFNSDLPFVCPAGWRVATTDDWYDYMEILARTNSMHKDSIQTGEHFHAPPEIFIMQVKADMFRDTLLNLLPIGWVEGTKKKNLLTLSMWMVNSKITDDKYHIHLASKNYHIHSHTHNIIDKPKKIRRFPVRCVCDVE